MQNLEKNKLIQLIRDYSTLSYQEGLLVGWRNAAQHLIDSSGAYYANGEDQKAQNVRQMGLEIRQQQEVKMKVEKLTRDESIKKIYGEIVEILNGLKE